MPPPPVEQPWVAPSTTAGTVWRSVVVAGLGVLALLALVPLLLLLMWIVAVGGAGPDVWLMVVGGIVVAVGIPVATACAFAARSRNRAMAELALWG